MKIFTDNKWKANIILAYDDFMREFKTANIPLKSHSTNWTQNVRKCYISLAIVIEYEKRLRHQQR